MLHHFTKHFIWCKTISIIIPNIFKPRVCPTDFSNEIHKNIFEVNDRNYAFLQRIRFFYIITQSSLGNLKYFNKTFLQDNSLSYIHFYYF